MIGSLHRAILCVALLMAPSIAASQAVLQQAGPVVPGHVPQYIDGRTVLDGGGAGGGGSGVNPFELGITSRSLTGVYPAANSGTGPLAEHYCMFDAPTTNPSGYHYLCFDPNAQGGGLIDYGSAGGATPLPLQINVNGALINLANLSLPLAIAQGGTAATTAAAARANLGAAASGANDDITSLGVPGVAALNLGFLPPRVINVGDPQWAGGAKCDGLTDDTAAFNAALNALRNGQASTSVRGKLVLPNTVGDCLVRGSLNVTGIASGYAAINGNNGSIRGAFPTLGPVGTLGAITGGSGYDGGGTATYSNVPLTGGTGSGCIASSVVVASGVVTSVTLGRICGSGYAVLDNLSATPASLGNNGGSGFSVAIASVSGGAVLDMTGDRFLSIKNLTVVGDCTATPNIGMQFGRSTAQSAGDNNFDNVTVTGCYSLAGMLNNAAESTTYGLLRVYNLYAPTSDFMKYGAIFDGSNHWNLSSSFTSVTAPVDDPESFNGNVAIGIDVRTTGSANAIPIWIGGSKDFRINGYLASNSYCAQLDQTSANISLVVDVHCETTSASDVFEVTSATSSASLYEFMYSDHSPYVSNSIFKLGSNITAAALYDAAIDVPFSQNAGLKLFDDPSKWTLGVKTISLPAVANWTQPGTLLPGGHICLGTLCEANIPTKVLNRNPDFVVDQPNEFAGHTPSASGQIVTDGWHVSATAGSASAITFKNATASPPTGYSTFLQTSIATPYSSGASDYNEIVTSIEGKDTVPLRWGTSLATYATLDFVAKANNLGTYSGSFHSSNSDECFVFNYTITAVNTWQSFAVQVPPITTGTFNTTENSIGLSLNFSMGDGSNFNATPGVWHAGNCYNTALTFNYLNTSGATLYIGAVHLRQGPIALPYQPRSFIDELTLDKRWYQKTFNAIAPKQNAGSSNTGGAVTMIAPYTQSTFSTVGTYQPFSPPMFMLGGTTAPAMTFYSTNSASAGCYDVTDSATGAAASAINIGANGAFVECPLPTGSGIGDTVQVHDTADTGS